MEFQNPFSICFASFLFLLVLFKLVNNTTTNLPPGPRKLPLIGNLHQFFGATPPYLRDLATKYGPLMHLKVGEVSNIIVTSPETAKEIMKTQYLNFSDRPHTLLTKIASYDSRNVSHSPYGNYWRQLRKICTIELLTASRVKSFESIRAEEVSELVKTLSACEGSLVNLTQKLYTAMYGITSRALIGKKTRYHQDFLKTFDRELHLAEEFCLVDLYPSVRVLQMMSKTKAKIEKVHKEMDEILQSIVDDHKNTKSSRSEPGEDLVDVLLKLQQEKDSEYALTDDNIKAVILDMFSGGGETASGTVEWAMAEMMRNPKAMEKAQAEVRRVYGSKGYVDESELHQLVYLKSVIKETLRLHPTLPLIPRENKERCKVHGYEIPANSTVIINAWAIGRDPKYWTEAESFKPERFLNSSIDYKGADFEYIPFGAGRRICPGMTFATPTIELPLAHLLFHFDWKLPNEMKNEELDMTESYALTLKKKNELYLIPIIHKP